MFYDRYKALATQQAGGRTFSVSLLSGYRNVPEGVPLSLYAKDASGNEAHFIGSRQGATITERYVENSTSGLALPTFVGTAEIVSAVGGEYLQRKAKRGGLIYMGQSNPVGYDTVDADPLRDFTDPRIREYAFDVSYLDPADEGMYLAQHPLHWPVRNPTANAVSSATHFASALIHHAGWGGIDILPCASGATSSSDWNRTSALYLRLVNMVINWLNMSSSHKLATLVWGLGETNALLGTTQASFEAFMENWRSWLIADVLAGGHDISDLTIISVGMAYDWHSAGGTRTGIQNALISAPYRMFRAGYVSADTLPQNASDPIHHLNAGQRILGSELLIEGYFDALGNIDLGGDPVANISIVLDGISAAGTATEVDPAVSASTANINIVLDGISAAGTATEAPASTRPLTAAIAGGTAYYAEEGVASNGSNHMLTWADFFGNNDMTFVNGGSDQILDAGADGINLVGAVQYNRSGRVGGEQMNGAAGTMIARFKGTTGFIIASDQNSLNLGDAVADNIYHMGNSPTTDLTSYNIDDNAWHEIAITKANDGTTNIWLDGSHIVEDAAGALGNSAAAVVIGTTTFNFYAANGNLSMLYFNKGLALNATQVANVLSERIVA